MSDQLVYVGVEEPVEPAQVEEPVEAVEVKQNKLVVDIPKLNLRSGPSKDASVVLILSKGDHLTFKSRVDETWVEVEKVSKNPRDQLRGYVMVQYLVEASS
jgi:uncharacterized protein YgiM (DUF1202 family)